MSLIPTKLNRIAATAVVLALAWTPAPALAQGAPATTAPPGLKDLFDAAWSRQPEARALQARRDAAQAHRHAAEAWTPEPPALEASHRTDRVSRNDGARELELGVAVPLWLPGERRAASALADAEATTVESRTQAARLRVAATVREAWWAWHLARVDEALALDQRDSARRLAEDVARRARAGDLARADQHQADGALAAAEARWAAAQAQARIARLQLKALTGDLIEGLAQDAPPGSTPGSLPANPPAEPEPTPEAAERHPTLAELQDRSALADRAAALASVQSRANPELTLATTRDRGAAGERAGQTITVAVRIPFSSAPRHDGRVAAARAEALEAQAALALERDRLQAERDAAAARVAAARAQQAAAERRATLARETRGFFDKSFRLGETDLPTRLRIEAEAAEAERLALRSRIEVAAAVSAWRQALGLLPQ